MTCFTLEVFPKPFQVYSGTCYEWLPHSRSGSVWLMAVDPTKHKLSVVSDAGRSTNHSLVG